MRTPSKYSRRRFLGAGTASFGLMAAVPIAGAEQDGLANGPVEDVGDRLPGPGSTPADEFVREALGIADLVVDHGVLQELDGAAFVLGTPKGELRYVLGPNVLLPRSVVAGRERLTPGYDVAIGSHDVGGSNVIEFVSFPVEMRSGQITRLLPRRRLQLGGEVYSIDAEAHLVKGGSRAPLEKQLRAGDVVDFAARGRPGGESVIEFVAL